MENNIPKIPDNAKIGDYAEYFQSIINQGMFWLLPHEQKEFVFKLDMAGICDITNKISPKKARKRAENPDSIVMNNSPPIEEIDNQIVSDNLNNPFRFGLGGGIAPPLSIRNRFSVK